MARTKFLVLQSSKMVQRPLGLSNPPLPPASVVNSTTSTIPTMEDLLIGSVGHRQVLDPLGVMLRLSEALFRSDLETIS